MPRKRTHDEMLASDPPAPAPPQEHEMLHKIRNMWEFAALYEFIKLFGPVVKVRDIDIEDLEMECSKPEPSLTLEEIGLQLLKFVSSRRDLTLENWDKTVRTQYEYKAKDKPHPYGTDEEPNRFRNFHVFTKLRVLYRLAQWTFHNPDHIRKHFASETDWDDQYVDWQAHPAGWDRQDRIYYKLNGNRLYRRTDPPIPEPTKQKPKAKSTSKKRKSRSSKRRKLDESEDADTEMADADDTMNETQVDGDATVEPSIANSDPEKLNTYGDLKWELVAMTLDDFNSFIATIAKSKDPNEKNLKIMIEEEMLPELEKAAERKRAKEQARLRDLQLQEKMQGAKRSGRLAAKQEKEREEAEAAEAERHRLAVLAEAHREEERAHKMENERQSRMLTREQRIREREYKRVLTEEQLAKDSEEEKRIEERGARGSRQLKERIERHKKELSEFSDDEWSFDCSGCGQHGKNWDDGEHSIACERCSVWQHSKCLGFSKAAAERDDFHFICKDCQRKEEDTNRPKISLKFKVGQSSSPPQPTSPTPDEATQKSPTKQKLVSVDVPPANEPRRPSAPGYMGPDGQWYLAPDPSRVAPPVQGQPIAPVTQPSMPGYAMRQAQRQNPFVNGTQQYNYNGYPPQERLPGNGHAQNLYNQVAYPSHPPLYPQQSTPNGQQYPLRPTSSHSQTPRPASAHSQANGHSSPMPHRIPSPIVNRPTMSPTQGNHDVGPIAGVPGSSPSMQPATVATPYTNGSHTNGMLPQSTPNQQPFSQNSSFSASQQSTTQPVSGLSPMKQRTSASPLPTPSLVPSKQGAHRTPSSSFNVPASRSVSGTPIFPPAENLAPSPQQLNREPVPTPSKHSPPLPQGSFENGQLPGRQDMTPSAQAQQRQQEGTVQ
ncbi:hypothetical protein PMZ80_001282 [Knufia obscura]|uniref:PHD-type domain-containing protein n=1 Tax=Knufia obscura TaxID=1635080 RepID=A0ABR0S3P4_9EURO|nr:hypothetical protein PMZ80_001282 [Knufia obscura]